MNDQPTNPGPDDPLDPEDLADLRALLADLEPPSAATRATHLQRAMAEFDRESGGRGDVVPLHGGRGGRRFERRRSWLVGVAAAAVVVVGVGLGLVLTQSGTSHSSDVASAARESEIASTTAGRVPAPQTKSAAGEAQVTSGAAADSSEKSVSPQAAYAAAAPVELGALADNRALRKAMTSWGAQDSVATTFAPNQAALDREAAKTAECATQLATLAYPRFAATVAGTEVIAAPATSAGLSTPTAPITVVALGDCTVRTI